MQNTKKRKRFLKDVFESVEIDGNTLVIKYNKEKIMAKINQTESTNYKGVNNAFEEVMKKRMAQFGTVKCKDGFLSIKTDRTAGNNPEFYIEGLAKLAEGYALKITENPSKLMLDAENPDFLLKIENGILSIEKISNLKIYQ